MLAWRELRRTPGRFVTATAILTLIALLLLFLGGLLDGLVSRSVAAYRVQPGELLVFSSSAEGSLLRSRLDPDRRDAVAAVPGVSAVGGLGVAQLGVRIPGNGPRELADIALWGYELAPRGLPATPPARGEAIADEVLEADGIEVGMTIEVGPARTPLTIVGFTRDTSYNQQGSVWASPDTWRDVQNANRPDARVGDDVFQVLVVDADGSTPAGELADRIDVATGGATESFTVAEAIDAIPGVSSQRSVFNQILGVTLVIAIVVVALFFALLTVERTALYGVLKAIGGRSSTLFAGVVLQAVAVTAGAALIGGVLALAMDAALPPGAVPFDLTPSRLVSSVALLLAAAVLGCAFSFRRVSRVDPASAIGGSA
jgi:putative ABC transport system permease protein